MKKTIEKKFVIALGGSTLFPEKINTQYFKKIQSFFEKEIKNKNKFIIICGGGHIARKYQKNIEKIIKITDIEKDWLGIYATKLNACFLKIIFKKYSNPVLFDSRFKIKKFNKYPIIIGSGWQPGSSTDFVAIQTAIDFKIKEVIILSNTNYVYTADFKIDKKAKLIKEISWKDYLKLIPSKWSPGLHSPVDPIGARLAQKKKIKVIVAEGRNLNNLKKILDNQTITRFNGTIIS